MSAPARHAAPEPAPAHTDAAVTRPDRRHARALVLLSLACAALLIAAPLAIVRSSAAQDGASQEAEVFRGADPGAGDDEGPDGGTGSAPLPETTPVPAAEPPALDTAGGEGVPGAPAGGDAGQGGAAPGWTAGSGWTAPGALQGGSTQPGSTQPGTAQPGTAQPGTTQPGTTQPGTTRPGTTQPGTTPIQILPSNPAPAPVQQPGQQQPPQQQPVQPQPQQPAPQPAPEPATDAEGVPCPCTLVSGVLVSLSRLVGGVLKPVGGLLGR